jgi:hypothetical protein
MPPLQTPNKSATKSLNQLNKPELMELAEILGVEFPAGIVPQIRNALAPVVEARREEGFGHADFAKILPIHWPAGSVSGEDKDDGEEWTGTARPGPAAAHAKKAHARAPQARRAGAAMPRARRGGGILGILRRRAVPAQGTEEDKESEDGKSMITSTPIPPSRSRTTCSDQGCSTRSAAPPLTTRSGSALSTAACRSEVHGQELGQRHRVILCFSELQG